MQQWKCAWCGAERGSGDPARTTHGICIRCVVAKLEIPTESLAGLPRAAVDRLPYGLVRLDEQNHVIEYNAAESALTGRPREHVMNRDFFREVAPCTNVRELAGWLAEARAAGEPRQKTIRFVFDFASGRQYVRLSLTCDGPGAPAHLLVRSLRTEDGPPLPPEG